MALLAAAAVVACVPAAHARFDLQAALTATPPGGTLNVPAGTYVIRVPLNVPAGITVNGNGAVLRAADCTTTASPDDQIMTAAAGDTITGLTFDGDQARQCGQWSEHRHALRVNGAGVLVTGDTFRDLIGDGVYATGADGLRVSQNEFDGDHANRNGVSLISGSNVTISDNTFSSMSRPDMPGAVDIEPNTADEAVAGVQVTGNTVNDPAAHGIVVWDSAGAPVSGVVISGNTVTGGPAQMAGGAAILTAYAADTVTGNTVSGVPALNGAEYDWAPGGSVSGNQFSGAANGVALWYSPAVMVAGDNSYTGIAGADVWSGP